MLVAYQQIIIIDNSCLIIYIIVVTIQVAIIYKSEYITHFLYVKRKTALSPNYYVGLTLAGCINCVQSDVVDGRSGVIVMLKYCRDHKHYIVEFKRHMSSCG